MATSSKFQELSKQSFEAGEKMRKEDQVCTGDKSNKRKAYKGMQALFMIFLVVSPVFLPIIFAPFQVPPEIAKYLKTGETVIDVQDLYFPSTPEYNMTVYRLSSGAVLIFSKKYSATVLGDDWIRIPQGDDLALQFYTAYYFSRVKAPDFRILENYPWYKGVEIYNNYVQKRLIQIGMITFALGVLSLALSGGTLLLLLSYAGGLANTLLTFIENNMGLTLENAPRAYYALVNLKPLAPDDMKALYETLDKLEKFDKEFVDKLRLLRDTLNLIDETGNFAQWSSTSALIAAARTGALNDIINSIGKEKATKFVSVFITGDKQSAQTFLESLGQWGSSSDSTTKQIAINNIENTLGDLLISKAISAGLSFLGKYLTVEIQQQQDSLIGFFGLHCLLLGDLQRGLNSYGTRLAVGDIAPTAKNVLIFYQFKITYYDLRDELFEGLEKYNAADIYDTGVYSLFTSVVTSGKSRNEIINQIKGQMVDIIHKEKNKTPQVVKEAIAVLSDAAEAFDKFKTDMSSRRKSPSKTSGLDIVLVIDVSGSMLDTFKGQRKIDAAIRSASDFTRLTSPYDRVGLVKFSTQATLVKNLTYNKWEVLDGIMSLTTGGATAIGDGLWLALDILERRTEMRNAAIILLTDGMNNAGIHAPEESAERAKRLGISVFTLGFGEKNDIDEDALKEVASITGGRYYYAPSPEDLHNIYVSLSGTVSGHITYGTITGVLKQGEIKEIPLSVSSGEGYFSVRVSYPGSLITITAITPSGREIDTATSNVVYYTDKGVTQLTVYRPQPGQWKIILKGVETSPSGEMYSAVLFKPGFTAKIASPLVVVPTGSTNQTTIEIQSLRDLPYLRIVIPETLSNYVMAQPSQITDLKEGQRYLVTLTIRAPPTLLSDSILLQTLDSYEWIDIKIKPQNSLAIAFVASQFTIFEGSTLTGKIWVLDDKGYKVPDAEVKAILKVKEQTLPFINNSYIISIKELPPGKHLIQLEASKPGYMKAQASLFVHVLIRGDVNGDDIVDYRDLAILVASYGKTNMFMDLNGDGIIDYKDIAITISNYGRKA
jgi:Mg-chelatase subunit ChlD